MEIHVPTRVDGVDPEYVGLLEVPRDKVPCISHQTNTSLSSVVNKRDTSVDNQEFIVTSIAPDGGWGWIVCFGSFAINFILDGTMFSFGVLMLELLSDLGQDKYTTSWIGSAQMGIHMCMGPVVSILLCHFSIRQVVVAGSLLSSAGFLASVFATNVYVLIFTYGVIGGIGFGMIFLPAIIVVGLYFNKRRAIATGIATSGSGLGTFAYAYLVNILLDNFSWRGTILILTGLLLHCALCGMLFRPLQPQQQNAITIAEIQVLKQRQQNEETSDISKNYLAKYDLLYPNTNDTFGNSSLLVKEEHPAQSLLVQQHVYKSMDDIHHLNKPSETCEYREETSPYKSKSEQNLNESCQSSTRCQHMLLECQKHDLENLQNFAAKGESYSPCLITSNVNGHDVLNTNMEDDSVLNTNMQGAAADLQTEGRNISNSTNFKKSRSDCHDHFTSKQQVSYKSQDLYQTFNKWFPLKLFTNKIFVLLLMVFTMWTAQAITMTYLPDYAVSLKISRSDAAFLVSVVGITNVLGRLVAGFITDCFHLPSIGLYFVALSVAAAANLGIPFCDSYIPLLLLSAVFGLCMAVAVSMRTIVLAEQMGVEALTESFGIVALFQGIAFTFNPPIAGKLTDAFQSSKPPFIMSASMYTISAVSALGVGCLNHFNKPSSHRKEEIKLCIDKH